MSLLAGSDGEVEALYRSKALLLQRYKSDSKLTDLLHSTLSLNREGQQHILLTG